MSYRMQRMGLQIDLVPFCLVGLHNALCPRISLSRHCRRLFFSFSMLFRDMLHLQTIS